MKIKWAHPEFFSCSIFLFLLLFFYLRLYRWKRAGQRELADLFDDSQIFSSLFLFWIKTFLKLSAIASLILALANPVSDQGVQKEKTQGVQFIYALDVSKSMAAEDIWPNRLEHAKTLINSFTNVFPSSEHALIACGNHPELLIPFTLDPILLKNTLEVLDFDALGDQGTHLGACIRQAAQLIDGDLKKKKILLLLSDGEDHQGGCDKALSLAQEKNLAIYPIGIGTEKGARVPQGSSALDKKVFKKYNGQWVVSRLNEKTLKQISFKSAGEYIDGNALDSAVGHLQTILDKQMDSYQGQKNDSYQYHFEFFTTLALLLVVLDFFLKDGSIVGSIYRWYQSLFKKT